MRIDRIQSIVLGLIFSPLIITVIANLVFSSSVFELASFIDWIIVASFILSSVYLVFFALFKILPHKFRTYFVFVYIFSYMLFIWNLIFVALYRAPGVIGFLANFSVVPTLFLLKSLWLISLVAVVLMFFMKIEKKTLLLVFCTAIVLTSSLVLAKELYFRKKISDFFGNQKIGQIAFSSAYGGDESSVFCLSDRKFVGISKDEFQQIKKAPIPNNLTFEAYEDSYDRDDLSKIYIKNHQTGAILLLTAGCDPVWIDR